MFYSRNDSSESLYDGGTVEMIIGLKESPNSQAATGFLEPAAKGSEGI